MSTPLDDYMRRERMTDAELAPKINRDRTVVSKIRRGKIKPTIDVAAAIERATAGAVPMQAWAA